MIKLIVNFKINEQHVEKKDNVYLVNKTKNYLKFNFTFNETWDDYEKYILFHSKEKNYEFLLPYDEEMECYSITVPSQILLGKHFRFSLYGIKIIDEDETRITTNDFRVRLDHSGYTQDISSYDDDTGIDDIFTIIQMELDAKADNDNVYNKADMALLLLGKSDLNHNHSHNDIVDFEIQVGTDLDSLLDGLTENIRIL